MGCGADDAGAVLVLNVKGAALVAAGVAAAGAPNAVLPLAAALNVAAAGSTTSENSCSNSFACFT